MENSHQQGFNPILPPQPTSMEVLYLCFLISLAKALILRPCGQEACSSQSESAQPPVPLDSLSGKKGRKARKKKKKERMPEEPSFPILMLGCAMKRQISEVYAELYRANITADQQNFINCLIDARNELLQRYVNVQRSFKIKKAMLSNHRNYRSSYDRLFEQACRLEIELDNLKKGAATYDYLQERLQASAPYKLIMELSAMEMENPEISFEELLAQEKEDTAFWQPNGKMRSISSSKGGK